MEIQSSLLYLQVILTIYGNGAYIYAVQKTSWSALGTGYNNDKARAVFAESIAQEQRETLLGVVSKARFFTL